MTPFYAFRTIPNHIPRHTEFDAVTNNQLDVAYTDWDLLERHAAEKTWDDVERNDAADEAWGAYQTALATARQNRAADLDAMLVDLEATQYAASYRGTA
jgi:hypothetical protein